MTYDIILGLAVVAVIFVPWAMPSLVRKSNNAAPKKAGKQ